MNISKEIKKTEALSRMRKLGYDKEAIAAFESGDALLYSIPFGNRLIPITPEFKSQIESLESEYNMLVYMAIGNVTFGYNMTSLLCVSDYEDEWEMESDELADGYAFTYTINHDVEMFSEFGSIGIQMINGVPHRV